MKFALGIAVGAAVVAWLDWLLDAKYLAVPLLVASILISVFLDRRKRRYYP